ncbi:MAG TPA: polysaccharide deacetylase family protein, partial [Anaerolineaceae bacterium]|nr:polysaccharide deacetylase family protein [Anaerolineaceae bacterium]
GLTAGKMYNALAALMEPLNQYACSATIPVTASALASNPRAARRKSLKGLEFAIHGLHHVDYSQLSEDQQLAHFQEAQEVFQELGISGTGFRSPYLRWNEDTLSALKKTGFVYDSSQALVLDVVGGLATDSYHKVLDFYGAQSANDYPVLPSWSDNLIRIPYCLPDDEALVDRLRITDSGVMTYIWLAMLEHAYQYGELFTLGLHPERAAICQAALQAVLAKASSLSPGVWIARLDEIATWFKSVEQTVFKIQNEGGQLFYAQISAPDRARILARSPEIIAATEPWDVDFQIVCSNNFFLRSEKRPVIGLSPDSPKPLKKFLRSQGYLTELSADSEAYSIYLDRDTFCHEDERSILKEIEGNHSTLVRLSRWPDGARCGLAITGDVDAFTIWDYVKRMRAR